MITPIDEKITLHDALEKIRRNELFHNSLVNGSFIVSVKEYSSFICTAIHDGHAIPSQFINKLAVSESERLYEEDPYTGFMINNQPISISSFHSRYLYDLNRSPEMCVYTTAWGKKVWKSVLTNEEISYLISLHNDYYIFLKALIDKIKLIHTNCFIYDIHSYNFRRINKKTPLYNIGTKQLNMSQWNHFVMQWQTLLEEGTLDSITVQSLINDVFYGMGYGATFVQQNYPENVLILPTEIKKVFMNELTGKPYDHLIIGLKRNLESSIIAHQQYYTARLKAPLSNVS